jgi:hypothetical protein
VQGQRLLTANASPKSGKSGMRFWLSSIYRARFAPAPRPAESLEPPPETSPGTPGSSAPQATYSTILSSFNMSAGTLPVATSILQGELLFYGALTYDDVYDRLLVLHTVKLDAPQDALEDTRIEGTHISLLDPETLEVVRSCRSFCREF